MKDSKLGNKVGKERGKKDPKQCKTKGTLDQ
jgi:hypothetical protein